MKHQVTGALIALAMLGAAGCGGSSSTSVPAHPTPPRVNPPGDIPDDQAFVAYTPPGGGYSVKVPEGWSRRPSGGAVTFTDKLNSIRMESMRAQQPPSVASARRTLVPHLARSVKGFQPGMVSAVS